MTSSCWIRSSRCKCGQQHCKHIYICRGKDIENISKARTSTPGIFVSIPSSTNIVVLLRVVKSEVEIVEGSVAIACNL